MEKGRRLRDGEDEEKRDLGLREQVSSGVVLRLILATRNNCLTIIFLKIFSAYFNLCTYLNS